MSVGVGLTVKIRLYSCMGADDDGGVGGQMDGLLRIGCVTGLSIVLCGALGPWRDIECL